ncbi:uncharacterized protein LOC115223855 isoform X2 [Octopus sinensis]|uniref:Uncharacterized protein LOC115223855 isoform X2 n=1 Tax=Octopus sinensis TaxID=2607531 RepID=A0A7E6FMK4_9MOLL|nr:uncharacterized protein LOC115223855 isoform X2 [Octopus sinensis]
MENVKLQSHLDAPGTRNEHPTVCVASTSSDGLPVAIKEEPLSQDTYEVLLYDKQLDEDADNDDNNNNNNDEDDDEEDEEDIVERFQIKCVDYDEDSYNNLIIDNSASNDASLISTNIQEKDASSDNTCTVRDLANTSESVINDFDAELSELLSTGGEPGAKSNKTLVNAKTCLFLNNIYQAVLQENLLKLQMELVQNQEKQKAINEELHKTATNKKIRRNVFYQPYFMSSQGMPPPNEHTKLLKPWHLKQTQRDKYWKKWEQDLLINAVQENAWEIILKPFMNKIEIYTDKLLTSKESTTSAKLQQKLDQLRQEMVQVEQKDINSFFDEDDFEDKLDWMKIANLTFCDRHSEFSCQLMWRNWLRPGINKKPWTKEETMRLRKLVELHGRHQWQRIAKELKTNRTPMHCLQHYRRELDSFTKRGWTEEEDKILKEVVDSCRIGSRIPWNQVSFYMEGRSSTACIARWTALDPSIKHGRWTQEEDSLLVAAVQIMGTSKWPHVRSLVPNRTANQCRERWVNCLDPGINSGPFTYEEDKLLLKYVKENGAGNWATVASHLPGRTDQICSTQYFRLKKWRDQANFVKKQSDESKSYFMPNFDASKYVDLVESGKSLDELIPLPCPSKYQNSFNNILQKWQQENLKRDLVKQELDSRKGDIFVPRPPLLRKFSPNVTKVWDTRNKLRQRIEEFVQSQLVESGEIKSKEKTDKAYSLMRSKLDQLKPSTRVSEILRVARGFSQKPERKGDNRNSKFVLAAVDQEIKDLLYVHWLKENYVNRLQPFEDEFVTQTVDERGQSRLQLLHLFVNALGPRTNLYQKIKTKRITEPLEDSVEESQREDFRLMFLSSFNTDLTSVNFSHEPDHTVNAGDTVPPNLATLNAMRMLLQEQPKLKKTAEQYDEVLTKDPDMDSLRERMNLVKVDPHYSLLQERFNTLFMWPGLLTTLNPKKQGGPAKSTEKKENPRKRRINRYPLITPKRNAKPKKVVPKTEVLTDRADNTTGQLSGNIAMQSGDKSVKTEILTSETSETLSSSTATDGAPGNVPQKRRVGRPVGAKSKPKEKVLEPVRSSRRQRGNCSKSPDDSKPWELNEEPTAKRKRRRTTKGAAANRDCTSLFASPTAVPTPGVSQNQSSAAAAASLLSSLSSSAASSSSSSSSSATAPPPPPPPTGEQELLSKLSPSLVQQVISQEVQVQPIGTYMNVTPP